MRNGIVMEMDPNTGEGVANGDAGSLRALPARLPRPQRADDPIVRMNCGRRSGWRRRQRRGGAGTDRDNPKKSAGTTFHGTWGQVAGQSVGVTAWLPSPGWTKGKGRNCDNGYSVPTATAL